MKQYFEISKEEIESGYIVDLSLPSEYVEFKIKQPHRKWGEIPRYRKVRIIAENHEILVRFANVAAQTFANQHQHEVRWNFDWSNQGHYVQPETKESN